MLPEQEEEAENKIWVWGSGGAYQRPRYHKQNFKLFYEWIDGEWMND